jgi:hypothetical protein
VLREHMLTPKNPPRSVATGEMVLRYVNQVNQPAREGGQDQRLLHALYHDASHVSGQNIAARLTSGIARMQSISTTCKVSVVLSRMVFPLC